MMGECSTPRSIQIKPNTFLSDETKSEKSQNGNDWWRPRRLHRRSAPHRSVYRPTSRTRLRTAKAALEGGFHVLSDKPATLDLAESIQLKEVIEATGKLYCLTHNYPGYPMVKQARDMVQKGEFGKIRKVVVEYPQGWLATRLEEDGAKQAEWRTDPKRSGAAGCMGDIGTHAENLAEYISGLEISELAADLTAFVDGRLLDDDGNVLLRFTNGAKGLLHASQISVGCENNLHIRVYGETGGVEWSQISPLRFGALAKVI